MSEDEAIKKLQEMIGLCTEAPKHIAYNEQRAIETILDLYKKTKYELEGKECLVDTMSHNEEVLTKNYEILEKKLKQEKEKNKEIEIRLQEEINEVCEMKTRLFGNSISKDKIRAEIKELEGQEDWYIENKCLDELYGRIDELKELLEEE